MDSLPIIIIGAGITGLSCAKYLQNSGKNVIILEAKNYIGGRIKSIKNEDIFDMGASWIHGIENNPIWEIAQDNNIKTSILNYSNSTYYYEKGIEFSQIEHDEFENHIKQITALLDNSNEHSVLNALNDILYNIKFIDSVFDSTRLKNMLFSYFQQLANDPFATTITKLSPNFSNNLGYFSGDEVIFPKGYIQIIEKFSKNFSIQINTEICYINYKKDYIELIDQNYKYYKASKVIITIPLGALKQNRISFNPPLPYKHIYSIYNIGFGSFNKVFMEFHQELPFRKNKHNKNNISDFYFHNGQWFNILDLSQIYKKPIYLMLFGGKLSEFIDYSSDKEIWVLIFDSLNKNFPNIPKQPKKIIVTRWGNDPYFYGSFSFPLLHNNSELVENLSQPIYNKIFFAGEHCSTEYAGTVHGAYLSGYNTASRIIQQD